MSLPAAGIRPVAVASLQIAVVEIDPAAVGTALAA